MLPPSAGCLAGFLWSWPGRCGVVRNVTRKEHRLRQRFGRHSENVLGECAGITPEQRVGFAGPKLGPMSGISFDWSLLRKARWTPLSAFATSAEHVSGGLFRLAPG